MARLTNRELYDSVPVGFKYMLPTGVLIEKREDGVYLDGKPMEPGPYYGCETVKDMQKRSAQVTAKKRRASTEAGIKAAQAILMASGRRVTITAVAKACKVSRQTIHRYYGNLFEPKV